MSIDYEPPVINHVSELSALTIHPQWLPLATDLEKQDKPTLFFDKGVLLLPIGTIEDSPLEFMTLQSFIQGKTNTQVEQIYYADKHIIREKLTALRQFDQQKESIAKTNSDAKDWLTDYVNFGYRHKASDCHIYLRQTGVRIHYRVNGLISRTLIRNPPYEEALRAIAMAFNWEGHSNSSGTFSVNVPRSTSLQITCQGENGEPRPVTLRLQTQPSATSGDCKCVIRLSETIDGTSLEQQGVRDDFFKLAPSIMRSPQGMVIIVGPTGSGKTTFNHGLLRYVPEERIFNTIEDPVELTTQYNPLIEQHNLNSELGYSEQMKTLLRQDPDGVMLGEMRDIGTANSAFGAALTGHLILTTLHATDCLSAIARLIELKVESSALAHPSSIHTLVSTRLLPALCSCAHPAPEDVVEQLRHSQPEINTANIRIRNKKGCHRCLEGSNGRHNITEFITLGKRDREFILTNDITGWRDHLKSKNWLPLKQLALNAVEQGIADPFDTDSIVDILTCNEDES